MTKNLLKTLPQVEKALQWPEIKELIQRYSRSEITRVLRSTLDEIRSALLSESLEAARAEGCRSSHGSKLGPQQRTHAPKRGTRTAGGT